MKEKPACSKDMTQHHLHKYSPCWTYIHMKLLSTSLDQSWIRLPETETMDPSIWSLHRYRACLLQTLQWNKGELRVYCDYSSGRVRLLFWGWLMSRQSIKARVKGERVSVRPYYMRMTVMGGLRLQLEALTLPFNPLLHSWSDLMMPSSSHCAHTHSPHPLHVGTISAPSCTRRHPCVVI